jgi:AraC-like DNA-binding protein
MRTAIRFSTSDVPAPQRLMAWNNSFGRSLSGRLLAPTKSPDDRFQIDMTGRILPETAGARTTGSVVHLAVTFGGAARRTRELLRDGNDDIVLHIQHTGRRVVSQLGREARVEPGGGVFTSNAEPSTIMLPGPATFVCISIPRTVITTLAPRVEDMMVRPLPANSAVLRVLTKYLSVLDDQEALRAPELHSAVTTHIYDLCALAAGVTRDAAEAAAGRGLRAARLRAVKADIAANLGHADLSAAALAGRHAVTPRYIHKLFELDGTTLSRFKLRLRLARVHSMLLGGHDELTISEIAYRAGFNDLSTFNREFRRHFGATPSDVRSLTRS